MTTPYTYIFVRTDLSPPQQIVQAAHAALEAGFRFNRPDETTHIVLIGANSQEHLEQISEHLQMEGIEFEKFYEPDYDTGYTAIATEPLVGSQRKPLSKYKLLRQP